MDKYCQNPLCEHPSSREVPVSVASPSDETRSLCDACKVAFDWGVQHGRMARTSKRLWVLAVADRGIVVQGKVFRSRRRAVHGLAAYLRANEGYSGPANMPSVSDWLAEHDERLGAEIFPASLETG